MHFSSISTFRILAFSPVQSLSGCRWFALLDQMKLLVLHAFCAMFNALIKFWILKYFIFWDLRVRCYGPSSLHGHFEYSFCPCHTSIDSCMSWSVVYVTVLVCVCAFYASRKIHVFICLTFSGHSFYYFKKPVFARGFCIFSLLQAVWLWEFAAIWLCMEIYQVYLQVNISCKWFLHVFDLSKYFFHVVCSQLVFWLAYQPFNLAWITPLLLHP